MKKRYISKKFKESPIIECTCGCGQKFTLYDKEGRERYYISGHNGRKYDDPTQYKREWNHRNRKKRYSYKMTRLHRIKAELLKLRGGECRDCGIKYDGTNAAIFDFHHRDPTTMSFRLGLNGLSNNSRKVVMKEFEKCDLLCANCHRLIVAGEY